MIETSLPLVGRVREGENHRTAIAKNWKYMSYLIDRKNKMTLWERIYLPEILRGLVITGRHFFKNLFNIKKRITIEYPEETKKLSSNYRAEHRLMKREDGSVRCTACMLCVTICPSKCITIEPEEVSDPKIEKRAKSFEINELRCVFCGLCVEACPCDAIRMDTARIKNSSLDKKDLIYKKDKLLSNSDKRGSDLSVSL